jgi:hypothetical protein
MKYQNLVEDLKKNSIIHQILNFEEHVQKPSNGLYDINDLRSYSKELIDDIKIDNTNISYYSNYDIFQTIKINNLAQQNASNINKGWKDIYKKSLKCYIVNELEKESWDEEKKLNFYKKFSTKIDKYIEETDIKEIDDKISNGKELEIEIEIKNSIKLSNKLDSFQKIFEKSQAILEFNFGKDTTEKIISGSSKETELHSRQFFDLRKEIDFFDEDGKSRISTDDQEFRHLHEWAKNYKELSEEQKHESGNLKKLIQYKIKFYEKFFEENCVNKEQVGLIINALKSDNDDFKKLEEENKKVKILEKFNKYKIKFYEKFFQKKCADDEQIKPIINALKSDNDDFKKLEEENKKVKRLEKIIDDFSKLKWTDDKLTDLNIIKEGFKKGEFKSTKALMHKLNPKKTDETEKGDSQSSKQSDEHKKLFSTYVDELLKLAEVNNHEDKDNEGKMVLLEQYCVSKQIEEDLKKKEKKIRKTVSYLADDILIKDEKKFKDLKLDIDKTKSGSLDLEKIDRANKKHIDQLYKLLKEKEEDSKKYSLIFLPFELFGAVFQTSLANGSVNNDAHKPRRANQKDKSVRADSSKQKKESSEEDKMKYIKRQLSDKSKKPSVETFISDYSTLLSKMAIEKVKDLFKKDDKTPNEPTR